MPRSIRGVLCTALIIVICAFMGLSVAAADFPDVEGHWAENELLAAAEKGWLTGFPDGTMGPDEAITGAQAVTLITRILDAKADVEDAQWYSDAAAAAQQMGVITGSENLDAPISRRDAFCMMAEGFQTMNANEDKALFDTYSDSRGLSVKQANAIASLINSGVVQGYNGSLSLYSQLTRAEFAALVTRLMGAGEVDLDGSVTGWSGNRLWIAASADKVNLSGVTADTVVIRSQKLDSLKIENCNIGTLVLSHNGSTTVKTEGIANLVVGTGDGKVTVSGKLSRLDVTGGRSVNMREKAENIAVSADGANVTLSGKADSLFISGAGNTVSANSGATDVKIYGADTVLRGGSFTDLYLRALNCKISGSVKNKTDDTDYGLSKTTVKLTYPDETLPAGETLVVTAKLKNAAEGKQCDALWYIDGKKVHSEKLTLQGDDEITLNHDYLYTRQMNLDTLVEFVLSYTTEYGEEQQVTAEYVQKIENHPDDYSFPMDPDRVLALVTTEYLGDYTTEWAEQNDYQWYEKEVWVNAKGYSSSSQYLLWINQSHQRVNIFEGEEGNWTLIRSCIVGCGADATPTPRGVYETTWNQPGWFTASYDVRPVVRFLGGGYAFHSRLYNHKTDVLQDPGIGYPISHGCIRMYDEDIQWIYDNVPSGTTVVSF